MQRGAVIGANASILGDITVGTGAVVGANSVVTRDVPAGGTVVGINTLVSRPAQKPHGAPWQECDFTWMYYMHLGDSASGRTHNGSIDDTLGAGGLGI